MTGTRITLLFNIILALVMASPAETYTPEPSNRVTINLGETPWKFNKGDPANAQNPTFNDAGWKDVGIPHCWYRKHFTLDNQYAGRKIFIEIEGAHVGAQAYINGTLIPGNSAVNPNATHVIGFVGFIVDVTASVQFGGTDNVFAVRVS